MPTPIYYVGSPAEVEHHARPLRGAFDVRVEDENEVLRHASAGDVCVFYNEFFPRYRRAIHELVRKQCATLYAIDGILEWRSIWEFPPGISCLWSARPILSHKVACIGRSQTRILESWGHAAECELVGIPRFDGLLDRSPRVRIEGEPFTILVLTAKCAGFNEEQLHRAARSLKDLKAWLEQHPRVGDTPLRSVWRITQGLENEVRVDNSLKDTTGGDLAQVLTRVDAVVTTPSTTLLEGMLQGLPVAMLDYNNCPHYVPAAWRITAAAHFDQVIPELVNPPAAKMHYQQHLLRDSLECESPALPRLIGLIARMHEIAKRSVSRGEELGFPERILQQENMPPSAEAVPLDYPRLFPANPAFAEGDLRRLQAEVADLRESLQRLRESATKGCMQCEQARHRGRVHRMLRQIFPKRGQSKRGAA